MAHVINLNQSEEVRFKFIEQEPNMAYLLDLKQSKYKYQYTMLSNGIYTMELLVPVIQLTQH